MLKSNTATNTPICVVVHNISTLEILNSILFSYYNVTLYNNKHSPFLVALFDYNLMKELNIFVIHRYGRL